MLRFRSARRVNGDAAKAEAPQLRKADMVHDAFNYNSSHEHDEIHWYDLFIRFRGFPEVYLGGTADEHISQAYFANTVGNPKSEARPLTHKVMYF